MNRIALGTVQFGLPYGIANPGGQVPLPEARRIVDLSRKAGIDLLDTAISYGDSEESLGRIGVDEFRIVSKLPWISENIEDIDAWVYKQVLGSISRLGISSLYGLLLHWPDQLMGSLGTRIAKALENVKMDGLVKKIGVSIYDPDQLGQYLETCAVDLVQAPFNLVDRRMLHSGWLELLKSSGIEIHIRSAFLQGLLLLPKNLIPVKFSAWDELFKSWHSWQESAACNPILACLAYLLQFPQIDRILIGVDTEQQLKEILLASFNPPTIDFPDISSSDERLINPPNWNPL